MLVFLRTWVLCCFCNRSHVPSVFFPTELYRKFLLTKSNTLQRFIWITRVQSGCFAPWTRERPQLNRTRPGWMLLCDVVTWVGEPVVQTWTLSLIVWTGGGLTGSPGELQLKISFDTRLNCPGAHVCLEHLAHPGRVVRSLVSNVHFLALSHLLVLTLVLFPLKLGSCRASEKGGDFLLDKHVINLREHILSHRKITEGKISSAVTQAGPLDCCGVEWPPPVQSHLCSPIFNKGPVSFNVWFRRK